MSRAMFNDYQNAHMDYLHSIPLTKKCWCGWSVFGECYNSKIIPEIKGHVPSCRPGKNCLDKLEHERVSLAIQKITKARYISDVSDLADAALEALKTLHDEIKSTGTVV